MSENVRSDPFLGPDWVPLADAIVRINREATTGFWRLQFMPSNVGVPAVFLQAAPRDDQLHVEVGGRPVGSLTLEERDSALRLAGWRLSAADSPDDKVPSHEYPLPYRRVTRRLEGTEDLLTLLRTLVVVLGVTPHTPLTFGPQWDDLLGWLGPFDQVGPAFWSLSQDPHRLQEMRGLEQPSPARQQAPRETVTVPTEPDPGSVPDSDEGGRVSDEAGLSLAETLSTGKLTRVNFEGAVLTGAQFEGAKLNGCRLAGAQLDGANFRGSRLADLDDGAALAGSHPFLRSRTPPDVVRKIVDMFQRDQLRLPYLPPEVGDPLAEYDETHFGTATAVFSGARRSYEFWPLVEQVAAGDWTPRVAFGVAGHGMNSYAWTYSVVVDRVAVFGQVLRGSINYNVTRVATEWLQLMAGITDFMSNVWPPDEDEGLIVLHNPMRGLIGATVAPIEGVSLPMIREALGVDREWNSSRDAREFLVQVQQWAEDGFE